MKCIISLVAILFSGLNLVAQGNFSAQEIKDIQKQVQTESRQFFQRISQNEDSNLAVFSIDTFKIKRTLSLKMDKNASTHGMLEAMGHATVGYDALLNRYYQLLLKAIKPIDKTFLINAQKAWIKFRDEDEKLIIKLNEEEYTGGGTMYQLFVQSSILDRVQKRTVEIFLLYNQLVSNR